MSLNERKSAPTNLNHEPTSMCQKHIKWAQMSLNEFKFTTTKKLLVMHIKVKRDICSDF